LPDEKLSLIRRFYGDRNSFNFLVGVGYHAFSVHLGDRITSLATVGVVPNVSDLLDLVKRFPTFAVLKLQIDLRI